MADVVFEGLDAFERFTRFTESLVVKSETVFAAGAEAISYALYDNTRKVYGDRSRLAGLAQATQDERVAKGYSADEPLLRDGELLRDSIERYHEGAVAAVGSSEPVMVYSEFGYVNARTGRPVPPRPAMEIGLHDTEPMAAEIANACVGVALGVGPIAAIRALIKE